MDSPVCFPVFLNSFRRRNYLQLESNSLTLGNVKTILTLFYIDPSSSRRGANSRVSSNYSNFPFFKSFLTVKDLLTTYLTVSRNPILSLPKRTLNPSSINLSFTIYKWSSPSPLKRCCPVSMSSLKIKELSSKTTLLIVSRNPFSCFPSNSSMGAEKIAAGSSSFSRINWESPESVRVSPALVYENPATATMSPADTSFTETYWLALTR